MSRPARAFTSAADSVTVMAGPLSWLGSTIEYTDAVSRSVRAATVTSIPWPPSR